MKVKTGVVKARPPAPSTRSIATFETISLCDVEIDRVRLPELLAAVMAAVRDRARLTICYVNVHCMNVHARDARYRTVLSSADIVYCDGTGVRLAAWLAGLNIPARLTGADWIDDLCREAVHAGVSLYLLGGAQGSADRAATRLRARHPGLRVAGHRPGYGLGPKVINEVNRSGADILLVGMGTPTQEKWISAHRAELDPPVVWAVGALFDFVSGRIPRGPRWMTEHGLEWLCRLAAEPRKLWRRYLIGNPQFFWRVLVRYVFPRLWWSRRGN